jgi:dipeptidyl aminopeptidase/acylaminoacyl peptidase
MRHVVFGGGRHAAVLALAWLAALPLSAQVGTPVDTVPRATAVDTLAAPDSQPPDTALAPHTAVAPDSVRVPAPLSPADFGKWESLRWGTLAPDGRWLAVQIGREDGEDELRIQRLGGDSVVVIPYGSGATFSNDGRWVTYSIGRSEEERKRLTQQDRTPEPRLGILDLARGDTALVPGVTGASFSHDGRYLAKRRFVGGGGAANEPRGSDLVVRDLRSGTDSNFGNVGSFAWQDGGRLLAMTVAAAGRAGNGVRIWNPATGVLRVLDSADADYSGLAWRPESSDLVALRAAEDTTREGVTHQVLVWKDVDGRTRSLRLDPTDRPDFPADTRITDLLQPAFSDDGDAIYLTVRPWPAKDTAEAGAGAAGNGATGTGATGTSGAGSTGAGNAGPKARATADTAGVEVWHSRDVDIIPRQKLTAARDRERGHTAIWHLSADRFVQLGDPALDEVQRVGGDRIAVGIDETPHEADRMFGPRFQNVYVIDTRTGERRRVIERVEYFFGASPEGRFLLYLRDDQYRVYDVNRDRDLEITGSLPTSFVNLESDLTVAQKPPFRFAGWTTGDRSVLLYDRYDVWEVRPDGSGGRRLTDGQADSTVYRYVRIGWDEHQRAIDPRAPAYYNITGRWSKRNGYAVSPRLDRPAERVIWLDAAVGRLDRARDADVFIYTVESFDVSPDYYVARGRLGQGTQVTRTNPFQSDYLWGRSELVEFENAHGRRLQGALFYPADYEPGRQYPMITYVYETRSWAVHRYAVPSERNAYNPAVWTAQGYFVFQPDIVYRERQPGVSAVEAIVPAVEKVLETGMIDADRIGLIGHSWGGYQAAFVPTQTDMFAASVAGAPLTELISMYLSVYWNTGDTDARIFEISQGRMEVPPWEDLDAYMANSPVFHIQRLNTPMLVAFGDEDGAVDWHQGIVLYNAARRAGKDLVLLVYEGENHGLARKPNQIDYHRRVNEWFAHYLKGEPAPAWIETGVPYIQQQEGAAAPAAP